MAESKNKKYNVKILGENHTVVTDKPQEYIQGVADLINSIGQEIVSAYPNIPKRKLIALTLMNIADNKFKADKKLEDVLAENKHLKSENKELKAQLQKMEKDNDDLLELLQEVE
ncbi:MAG: cell division protein ZapA [Bacillota bacterium]